MGDEPGPTAVEPHTYAAYGLRVRSALPLPPALPHTGTADVEIRPAPLSRVTAGLAARDAHTWIAPGEAHLRLPRIATFLIRAGAEILVDPERGADDRLLHLAILGPVLAALLQQRGRLVLHASAVEVAGTAVGFMGACGAGKSTTAAALGARGYPILTDDLLPVSLRGEEAHVARGLPQLKLRPDAVRVLGGDPDALPRTHPLDDKRAQRIEDNFCGLTTLPLARLYVLCNGEEVRIDPLPVREAFLQVVAHTYGIEWLHEVSGPQQLRVRAELVRRVPIARLQRPPDLEAFPRVMRLLEEDLGRH